MALRGGRLSIGQAGQLGGEPGGVKASRRLRYALSRFHELRATVDSRGEVKVYFNDGPEPVLTAAFDRPVPGWAGYRAVRAKSFFDDFEAVEEIRAAVTQKETPSPRVPGERRQ